METGRIPYCYICSGEAFYTDQIIFRIKIPGTAPKMLFLKKCIYSGVVRETSHHRIETNLFR